MFESVAPARIQDTTPQTKPWRLRTFASEYESGESQDRLHHAAKSSSYDLLLENSCVGFNCVVG